MLRRARCEHSVGHRVGVGTGHGQDLLRRDALEDAREVAARDGPAEVLRQRVQLVGHVAVDAGEQAGRRHRPVDLRRGAPAQGAADEPQHEHDGDHAGDHAEDLVGDLCGAHGEVLPQPRPEQRSGELAEPGEQQHRDQHGEGPLQALLQAVGQRRDDLHREQGPGQEAAQRQRADGQTLPPAGHGVRDDHDGQDEVDHGTSSASASASRRERVGGSGTGSIRSRLHGRSQPARARTRSRMPAVKPQTNSPRTANPGPM